MILKKWLQNKYIWIVITGLLLSFGIAVTVCSPKQPVRQIANRKLVSGGYGWSHISENPQTIYINNSKACIEYDLKQESKYDWKYREMYISDLTNSKMIQAEVLYYDGMGNWTAVSDENWGNGYNLVEQPTGTFRKIRIYFYNQENSSFTIQGLRFRETVTEVSKKKILALWVVFFMCYLAIAYGLSRFISIRRVKNELIACMEELWGWLDKQRIVHFARAGRTVLWAVIFLAAIVAWYFAEMGDTGSIRYIELGILVAGILLAHSYSQFHIKKKRVFEEETWIREGLEYIWSASCIFMMISDFFVQKRCQYIWILLLFAGGYLLHQINSKDCIYEVMTEGELGFILSGILAAAAYFYLKKAGMWQIAEPSGLHELVTVWKNYILNMNVPGHDRTLFVTGRKILPYNGILKIGYMYGTVMILPYVIFWVLLIRQSVCCFLLRKKKEYLKEFGILLFFLVSMFLNVI